MVIYEVNIEVDRSVAAEYEAWIPSHIEKLLKLDGFLKADVYASGGADNETHMGVCWTFHYQLRDQEALNNYFQNHAPQLRQEAIAKFKGRFTANRRVLIPKKHFEAK